MAYEERNIDVSKLTSTQMTEIAKKMNNSMMEQYWDSLKAAYEYVVGINK